MCWSGVEPGSSEQDPYHHIGHGDGDCRDRQRKMRHQVGGFTREPRKLRRAGPDPRERGEQHLPYGRGDVLAGDHNELGRPRVEAKRVRAKPASHQQGVNLLHEIEQEIVSSEIRPVAH